MWYNASFNVAIIKLIQSFSNPFLDKLSVAVTMMGEETFFMIAAVIVYWCIDKNFGYLLGFSYISNAVINDGIKEMLQVPRPIGEPGIRSFRLETATGYSFPSGHAQCSTSFWTSVMIKLKKKWINVVGVIFIILVGISRLYLGVHRPIDVVAGIIVGAFWVYISNYMFCVAEKTGSKTVFLVFIIPMCAVLFVLKSQDFYKPMGATLAFYIGYLIEPKYIKYDVKARFPVQIVKLVSGLAVLVGIRLILKQLFPQTIVYDFIRYFLMGIWVTIGAPYLFKKIMNIKHTDKNNMAH